MLDVTTQFEDYANAKSRPVSIGCLISFRKVVNDDWSFFEAGTSEIEGPDLIPGEGDELSFFDRYQFEEYSRYVLDAEVTQGLSHLPYGVILGQLDVTLGNDGTLTPHNEEVSGEDDPIAHYTDKPNRPIKLSIAFGQEYINQFSGFTGQPVIGRLTGDIDIHAFDSLKFADDFTLTTDFLLDVSADEVMAAIFTEMGLVAAQYNLELSSNENIPIALLYNKKAGTVLAELCEAEGYILFVDENGIIQGWNRNHLITAGSDPVWSFDFDRTTDLEYSGAPIINHIKVTAKPREVVAEDKVWESSTPLLLAPGESQTMPAEFRDEFGQMPVTVVNEPDYQAVSILDSYFSTNPNEDGSGTPAGGDVTLDNVAHFADTYLMTFTNTTGVPQYVTKVELYGTAAKVLNTVEAEYKDAASIEEYGRNPDNNGAPLEIENDYIQNPSDAQSLGFIIVERRKAPRSRVKKSVHAAPQLQFGDVITISDEATGSIRDMQIMGRGIRADADELKQTFELEEFVDIQPFTIEESLIEGPDVIAP